MNRHLHNLILLASAYEAHSRVCAKAAFDARAEGNVPAFNRWEMRAAKYACLARDMNAEAVEIELVASIAC